MRPPMTSGSLCSTFGRGAAGLVLGALLAVTLALSAACGGARMKITPRHQQNRRRGWLSLVEALI